MRADVESMFAKELERRQKIAQGAAADSTASNDDQTSAAPPPRAPPQQAYQSEPSQTPQLDRSRQLNSEGLEGLIPRASVLLQVGVTFFLGFLPLIAIVGGLFGALYFVRFLSPVQCCCDILHCKQPSCDSI
jgi:hypothetical protein